MQNEKQEYYLGFDIGTNSVGWAVTDENYHVLNFRKRAMWGIRLFEEAQVAESRRMFRTTRRRLQRRRFRIELLQELFAEEICKVDPGFYQRLKDSALYPEDKAEQQKYSFFHDADYTDADFYREYPTIYHLRKALLTEERTFDVRLVYLALHHIIKHRGHFLFPGSVENAVAFETAFDTLQQCMEEELDLKITCQSEQQMADCLRDKKKSKRDKQKEVAGLLYCDCDSPESKKQLKAVTGLLCGMKTKISDVFADEMLKEMERAELNFSSDSYDEIRPELEADLQERCIVLDKIKAVYDWAVLADILKGGEYEGTSYLSVAKVASYEKHRKDLASLKRLMQHCDEQTRRNFFQKPGKSNYSAYVGFTLQHGKKIKVRKCSYEDFRKELRKIFSDQIPDTDEEAQNILQELDAETFLPLQVTKDNGVVPYQVHKMELNRILERAERYLPFLSEKDSDGICTKEKIMQIFEFRVPYYVGPLNTNQNEHAWAVRREGAAGRILPWNIEQQIDYAKSGEQFIRRMTNKCTYLIGKDVLPKCSLLYSEFMVWNEINTIKIGSERIPETLKQKLFETCFLKKRKVTRKMIDNFLISEGVELEQTPVSGIDIAVKSALTSYHDFRKIFGDEMQKYEVRQMVEQIICWITVYGDAQDMLKRVIRQHYSKDKITDEQLRKIIRLHYQGWGRLSEEFLNGIVGTDRETGERFTIIQALRTTNANLNRLLSQNYSFTEEIEAYNAGNWQHYDKITYDAVMKDRLISPAVKRAIWQTVLIEEEVRKIMGKQPRKIFIEMTRAEREKKRTTCRKEYLLELYRGLKDETRDWTGEIERTDEKAFRSIRLFLYYTQMGRCMYTGDPIDLDDLDKVNIYDRDHIYPQSKTKDDSFDNLVLVKKDKNQKKDDKLISPDIQQKMKPFWNMLKDRKLISEKKYERLLRKTPLTDEELSGFINRQLVETSQSSKMAAEILKEICPDATMVYVKAGRVSEFRKEPLKMVKVRSLNDLHHAKDAYLNIVVGNVYYEKFTNNPLNWLRQNPEHNYSLNRMYEHDLCKGEHVIWKKGDDGTIRTVREQMLKNDILYTRYATITKNGQNGGFFDQNPVAHDKNPGVPLKKGMDKERYGGYKTLTPAYFALVESEEKGKKIRTIEAVPLYLKDQFEKGSRSFEEYCEEAYGLKNPRVILPKIKKDACLSVNRFPMHIRGISGKQLLLQGAVQLCLSEELENYLKKVEKYNQRNSARKDKKTILALTEHDGITREENESVYQELCSKLEHTVYRNRPNESCKALLVDPATREKFQSLCCEEQCLVLQEMLWLFGCSAQTMANLILLGGSAMSGKIIISKKISSQNSVVLLNQSVTGLFEQKLDLLKI